MLLPGPSRGDKEGSGLGWRAEGEGGLQLVDKEELPVPAPKRCQTLRAEWTGSRPLSSDSAELWEGDA